MFSKILSELHWDQLKTFAFTSTYLQVNDNYFYTVVGVYINTVNKDD